MEDELELGEGFSGMGEEYELGEERPMSDEVSPPEVDEDDDTLAGAFGIGIDPPSGYLNQRFTITVFGSPAKIRRIKLCTSKPGYGRANDPVFATMPGDGTSDVIGTTFLRGRKLDPTVPNAVYVYAQADIPWRIDKYTPSAKIELLPTPVVAPAPTPTPTPTPAPAKCREGAYSSDGKMICRGGVFVPVGAPAVKEYLTSQEADEWVRAGKPCYIKCMIPILNILPGLPYSQGFPILPGFAITTKP